MISGRNPTYRANDRDYFAGAIFRDSRHRRFSPRVLFGVVRNEGDRGGRNSCAACLFRGNVSGVLGGINRRYARIVVTNGTSSGGRAICRVTSLCCRMVILVVRVNVSVRSVVARLRSHRMVSGGIGRRGVAG